MSQDQHREHQPDELSAPTRKMAQAPVQPFQRLAAALQKYKTKKHPPPPPPAHQNIHSAQSPDQALQLKKKIKKLWGPTLTPSCLPGATIRIPSLAPRPSLPRHIPQRQFALPQQAKSSNSDYTILEKIADGGMGVVFIGQQRSLKRQVALKTIKEDIVDDEPSCIQFLTEAMVTGELDHPNIVPIYELGTNGDGLYFYAMKHVRGISWQECISKKSQEENLEILMKVCDALAFAHSRKIIHRDLKPENVMIGEFGEVLLMDWGLASASRQGEKSDLFGKSSGLGGTPAYMPPECARGDGSKIGIASDIYLIGALLYEIIAGFPPHLKGNSEDSLQAAADNFIPKLKTDSELLSIALRAMETNPEDRFPSVPAMQESIRNYRLHEESLNLTSDAHDTYTRAQASELYEEYSAGMHACHEALKLWGENSMARELGDRIRLDYARLAIRREDYDLSLTLLRQDHPVEHSLRNKVTRMKHERARRLQFQQHLKYGLIATTAFALMILISAYTMVSREKTKAVYTSFINQTRLAERLLQDNDWVGIHRIAETIPPELRKWEWDWLERSSQIHLVKDGQLPSTPVRVFTSPRADSRASLLNKNTLLIETRGHRTTRTFDETIKDVQWMNTPKIPCLNVLHGTTITRITPSASSGWQDKTLTSKCREDATLLSPSAARYLAQPDPHHAMIFRTSGNQLICKLALNPNQMFLRPTFSWDEKHIAAFSLGGNLISVFDTLTGVQSGRSGPSIESHIPPDSRLQFTRDDRHLIEFGKPRSVEIYDAVHMNPDFSIPTRTKATDVGIAPEDNRILIATRGGELALFDIASGKSLWKLSTNEAHVVQISHAETPGEWLLYGNSGNRFRLSESLRQIGEKVLQNPVPILKITWSQSLNAFITIDQYRKVRLIPCDGAPAQTLPFRGGHYPGLKICRARGAEYLIGSERQRGLIAMNLATRAIERFPEFTDIQGIHVRGSSVAITQSHQVTLLSLETKKVIRQWDLPGAPLDQVMFTNNHTVWLSSGRGHHLKFNLNSGQSEAEFQTPDTSRLFIPSPDKKVMLVLGRTRISHIYDMHSGKPITSLTENQHSITAAVFSPDGKRLFGCSADGYVHIWDTTSWKKIVSFHAHTGAAIGIEMSADGNLILTSGTDGAVRIWDGTPLRTLKTED